MFISADKEYDLEITGFEDTVSVRVNKDLSKEDPAALSTAVQSQPEVYTYAKFVEEAKKVLPAENFNGNTVILKAGQVIELPPFAVQVDNRYANTSVTNKFKITFKATKGSEVADNETAQTGDVTCIGECPQAEEGCWPVNGEIAQKPFNIGFSHGGVDAYDISATAGTAIYAPYPGQACGYYQYGKIVFNADKTINKALTVWGYGYYVDLTVNPDNGSSPFVLKFGHMLKFQDGHDGVVPLNSCVDVEAGKVLGVVGSTGASSGNHLHYEYVQKKPASPLLQALLKAEDVGVGDLVKTCYE